MNRAWVLQLPEVVSVATIARTQVLGEVPHSGSLPHIEAGLSRCWWSSTTHQYEKGPVPMLSEEDDVDIHALKRQGMTVSEIARRTDHDRKTIRAYLAGQRTPGVRERAEPDLFDAFVDYVTARLAEDPHLWAVTLLDELVPLGFTGSYQTLTRQIRDRSLRLACTACAHVTKRPTRSSSTRRARRPSSTGSSC